MESKQIKTIDEYILEYPEEIQKRLYTLRDIILKIAPEAGEKISWGMPTFTYNGNLVHFAAAKNHIGLYPAPSAIEAFSEELKPYKTSKGAVQFPNNQDLPLDLISRMVEYRLEEQRQLKASKAINEKEYSFIAELKKVPDIDGAYIEFPYNVKEEFGSGRVKIHATFDGVKYDGSLVRMGTPGHIIGVTKSIRAKIEKQPGDAILVTIRERIGEKRD